MGNLPSMLKILWTQLPKLLNSLMDLISKTQSSTPVSPQSIPEKPSQSFHFKASVDGKTATGTLSFGTKTWPAVSGPWGKGYLPAGEYEAYGFWDTDGAAYSYVDKATGEITGFYVRLEPKFKTDRDQLLIHFDGNVEGSLGCIAIKCDNRLKALDIYFDLKKIMQAGKLPLTVSLA